MYIIILQNIFNRVKKLVVSHFSKNGELNMEFNGPVEVKYNLTQFNNILI